MIVRFKKINEPDIYEIELEETKEMTWDNISQSFEELGFIVKEILYHNMDMSNKITEEY